MYKRGSIIEIHTDYTKENDEESIACSYKELPISVKLGGTILLADGSLSVNVVEIKAESVMVEVLNKAKLGPRKNMNLPGCVVLLPTLTE